MFRFATPSLFLLMIPLLIASWRMIRNRTRGAATLTLPQAKLRFSLSGGLWTKIDQMLPLLRIVALALLIAAMARPQAGSTIETTSTLGVDIVIVLDTSQSMRTEDYKPVNRLGAAKLSIDAFVAGRPGDRLGLVSFASLATTTCPLTLDHEMLRVRLEEIDISPRDLGATAIGMGLATAVNRLRDSKAESRVVVLLTDGKNTEGEISPEAAAQAAKALGVKVYTIGVGSAEVAQSARAQMMGQLYEIDEQLLREIADVTGGEYFHVKDDGAMSAVFETIDQLEKTEIESQERTLYQELFGAFIAPALLLLLLERALLLTRLRRIP
jgi:Ca-activated chloride channel family protein